MKKLHFYANIDHISFIILTGACRVGKTSLASFLAQHPQIEYLDEPWEIMMFPFLQAESLMHNEQLASFFKAMLKELANDIMLYRRTNLRFNDASSVWKSKSAAKIYERLLLMNSRSQAQKALVENEIKILLILPETTPFIEFFFQQIPHLQIIHLTRDGIEVADEIARKGWFSLDQLKTPQNSQPYQHIEYKNQSYFLPWWVDPQDSDEFISVNDFERGLWYWEFFYDAALQQQKKLTPEQQTKLLHYNLQKLVQDTKACAQLLSALAIPPLTLSLNFSTNQTSSPHCNPISWSNQLSIFRRNKIQQMLEMHARDINEYVK